MTQKLIISAAFAWGLLEATIFFLVPDILLSIVAVRSLSWALAAVVASVVGSLTGACVMYLWLSHGGAHASAELVALWQLLPGFFPRVMTVAAHQLQLGHGASGLLSGPASGLPYRVFLLECWLQSVPLGNVLLFTVPARLERILIAPLVVSLLRLAVTRVAAGPSGVSERGRQRILLIVVIIYWLILYAWYWTSFLPQRYSS